MTAQHNPARIAGTAPGFLLRELDRIVSDLKESGRFPEACRSTVLGPSLLEIAIRLGVLNTGAMPIETLAARFSFAPLLPDAPENVSAFLGELVWLVREAASGENPSDGSIEVNLPDRLQAASIAAPVWETLWIPSIRRAVDRYEMPYPTADLHGEYLKNIDCRLTQLDELLPRLETIGPQLKDSFHRFLEMFRAESDQLIWNDSTRETLERVIGFITARLK